MRKKLLSVALAASLVLGFAGCGKTEETVNVETEDSSDVLDGYMDPWYPNSDDELVVPPDSDFEYEYDAVLNRVKIWDYLGREKKIKIPSEIDGDPVKSVSLHNSSLEVVEYPDSMTTIEGSFALGLRKGDFDGCYNLTKIILPDGVKEIGYYAFDKCGMKEIEIPDSVTFIDGGAFALCENLERITLPESITSIGSQTFYCCSSLKEITIPDSVRKIDDMAFYYCEKLKSLTLPDGVTSIGDNVFSCCDALTVTYKGKNYNYSNWDDLYKAIN
ncbi:MAG: leucine-rich repeat protein, partial [Ruminiclostridium sp.]